jgi:hypothetical protein
LNETWKENRAFVAAIVVWLAGSVLFYLVVHLPLSGPVAELDRSKLTARLGAHYARPGQTSPGEPFARAWQRAEARRKKLDAALAEAGRLVVFEPRPEYRIPADAVERRVEYVRIRDATTSRLTELANKAGVQVPAALDPRPRATGLPGKEELDELLMRLAITDRVVRAAAAAPVPRVEKIEHVLSAPRGAPLSRRLVKVRVVGDLNAVVRFLDACSTPPGSPNGANAASGGGILTVESADLASGDGDAIAADLTLAAIALTKLEEPKLVEKKEPKDRTRHRAGRSF